MGNTIVKENFSSDFRGFGAYSFIDREVKMGIQRDVSILNQICIHVGAIDYRIH